MALDQTPNKLESVWVQRNTENQYYEQINISGSDLIVYHSSSGEIQADKISVWAAKYGIGTGGGGTTVKVTAADTTADYLYSKLVAGANIALTVNNPGANETITITSAGGGVSDQATLATSSLIASSSHVATQSFHSTQSIYATQSIQAYYATASLSASWASRSLVADSATTATTATNANNVGINTTNIDYNYNLTFVSGTSGYSPIRVDSTSDITFNPLYNILILKGGTLSASAVTASLGFYGTASQAVSASWAPFTAWSVFASSSFSSSWASSSLTTSYINSGSGYYTGYVYGTGSLFGTASWAVSASWAPQTAIDLSAYLSSSWTGSNTSQFSGTSSYALSASTAANSISASYALSASFALSASWAPTLGTGLSTGSTYPITASYAVSASYSKTSSVAIKSEQVYINVDSGTDFQPVTFTQFDSIFPGYSVLYKSSMSYQPSTNTLRVTNLEGTASWAISASWAPTPTFPDLSAYLSSSTFTTWVSSSTSLFSGTSSFAESASWAPIPTFPDLSAYLSSSWTGSNTSQFSGTSSYALTAASSVSSSYALSASFAVSASWAPTPTFPDLSSYLSSSWTGSNTSQFAGTSSYATVAGAVSVLSQGSGQYNVGLLGSNAGVVNIIADSNGDIMYDVSTNTLIVPYVTTTASFAVSASWAPVSAFPDLSTYLSSSWTGSNTSQFAGTSSYAISASVASSSVSSSFAISASWAPVPTFPDLSAYLSSSTFNNWVSASTSLFYGTASFALSSSNGISSSYALSASWALSASYARSASYAETASYISSAFSHVGTASYALYAESALSASWAPGGTGTGLETGSTYPFTSSWAVSASWAPTVAGSGLETGSTYPFTASWAVFADSSTTADFAIDSTYAVTASYVATASRAITASYVSGSIQFSNINSGSNNYVPKWRNSQLSPTSSIYDSGSAVGINTTNLDYDAFRSFKFITVFSSNVTQSAVSASIFTNPGGNSEGQYQAIYGKAVGIGTTVNDLRAGTFEAVLRHNAALTSSVVYGLHVTAYNSSSVGELLNLYGVYIDVGSAPVGPSSSPIATENAYAIYIKALTAPTADAIGNKYAIYQAGSGDKNYFAGSVGIGIAPTAQKVTVAGNVVPSADDTYTLGTTTLRWKTLYATATTSSVYGTSSFAVSASWAPTTAGSGLETGSTYPFTASWAVSASWAPGGSGTGLETGSTYPITASHAISSSWALSASYAPSALQESASYAVTASHLSISGAYWNFINTTNYAVGNRPCPLSTSYAEAFTVTMPALGTAYVKLTVHGADPTYGPVLFMGEYALQKDNLTSYGQPGSIMYQYNNNTTVNIQSMIPDRDYTTGSAIMAVHLRTTTGSFTGSLVYEVRGNFSVLNEIYAGVETSSFGETFEAYSEGIIDLLSAESAVFSGSSPIPYTGSRFGVISAEYIGAYTSGSSPELNSGLGWMATGTIN